VTRGALGFKRLLAFLDVLRRRKRRSHDTSVLSLHHSETRQKKSR